MIRAATRLRDALVDALPGHLTRRLGELAVTGLSIEPMVSEATAASAEALDVLLVLPFDRQAETPLQVVRMALEPLNAALQASGVVPSVDGEGGTVDPYGLAPVSAGDLGDEALQASLAWGVAKSSALARPTLLVVTSNLMDGSRFESAAATAGYRLETSRDGTFSTTPLVAFVDLESSRCDDVIRVLVATGVKVIAYGPHVDEFAMGRARALGADAAEPRSRMFSDPTRYLAPLV